MVGFSDVLGFQMGAWGRANLTQISLGAVQDGLGIVLVWSFFRLAVWVRFFGPLGRLLGSSWVAFGLVLDHLGLSWARFGSSSALLGSFSGSPDGMLEPYNPKFPSTH